MSNAAKNATRRNRGLSLSLSLLFPLSLSLSRVNGFARLGAVLSLPLALSACALFEDHSNPPTYYGPREQVFFASFEEVWRAVNLVLQPYPLKISNMDQGALETDMIHGYKVWGPPFKSDTTSNGESYKLTVHVVKGALERRAATKVTLLKDTEVQVDFFSEPRGLPSDGLEEKTILYRIGREISIERALAKAQKKHNDQSN